MFVRQNQQQFRNSNADVQFFYGTGTTTTKNIALWNKPPGVSHVYMMLIGAGGTGDGTTGGGSGAVTVWYGAAQNVPDVLEIFVGRANSGSNTVVGYRSTASSAFTLLAANASLGTTGPSATGANNFAASGFYQSVAGQSGTTTSVSPSGTTFLAGGGVNGSQDSNYGYGTPAKGGTRDGYLLLQPVIVGVGGMTAGAGGVGCGGGSTGAGGQGMVLIASW